MATKLKAPPSDTKEIVEVPWAYRETVERLSPGGRYVDMQSDVDSPWVPFGEGAAPSPAPRRSSRRSSNASGTRRRA